MSTSVQAVSNEQHEKLQNNNNEKDSNNKEELQQDSQKYVIDSSQINKMIEPCQSQKQQIKPSSQILLLPLAIPINSPEKRCCGCRISEKSSFNKTQVLLIEISRNQLYCDLCLDELLKEEQESIRRLQQKYIYQKQFETSGMVSQIKDIKTEDPGFDKQYEELQKSVEDLENENSQIDQMIYRVKKECSEFQEAVYALEKKEDKFWQDINKFQKRALKLQYKAFTAKSQKQIEKFSLDEISKKSVIHQFFDIQIGDNYAQVHGLIIGKKPDMFQVNWDQTNAGLAHLLLAYNYLTLKYGIPYTRIEDLKIKGSLSEILLRNSTNYYPVVYLGRENQKIFGLVMDTLLLQLHDLAQTIQEIQNIQYTQQLKLPFSIDIKEAKILQMSVNPSKIEEKSKWNLWTKAMRYFLIDFKHLLTISSLYDPYL